jgi:NADH-quinone oxidoreductase subunit H
MKITTFIYLIIQDLIILVPILISIAYFTLAERKVLASIQLRKGPNVVGVIGILQPLIDGLKLLFKESIFPNKANIIIFVLSPIFAFSFSLTGFSLVPFNNAIISNLDVSILFIFVISSLSVYGLILAGWASNSKFSFLGCIRATAQMIAYELTIGLTYFAVLVSNGSMSVRDLIGTQMEMWNIIPLFPFFICIFICMLAETNRTPFDLAEAEAELVSGYNVEYSSMSFALFYLGEQVHILFHSALVSLVFFGGPSIFLIHSEDVYNVQTGLSEIIIYSWKTILIALLFIVARGLLPRYRYDTLMLFGWKTLLPTVFIAAMVVACSIVWMDSSISEYNWMDACFYIKKHNDGYRTNLHINQRFSRLGWPKIKWSQIYHGKWKYGAMLWDPVYGSYLNPDRYGFGYGSDPKDYRLQVNPETGEFIKHKGCVPGRRPCTEEEMRYPTTLNKYPVKSKYDIEYVKNILLVVVMSTFIANTFFDFDDLIFEHFFEGGKDDEEEYSNFKWKCFYGFLYVTWLDVPVGRIARWLGSIAREIADA